MDMSKPQKFCTIWCGMTQSNEMKKTNDGTKTRKQEKHRYT